METEELEQISLGYWSGRAPEYSALHMDYYHSEKVERFRALIHKVVAKVTTAEEGQPVRVLDLGCGSGFMSLLALGEGCQVTGIDFSIDMGAQAVTNVAAQGFEGFDFRQMRAQELDFADDTFDLVVSRNVTWVLEAVDQVYAEVLRVLKPGGKFLNLDSNSRIREAVASGKAFTHPTQTQEQLQTRNYVAVNLDISGVERPGWDLDTFWRLGATKVACKRFPLPGPVGGGPDTFCLLITK